MGSRLYGSSRVLYQDLVSGKIPLLISLPSLLQNKKHLPAVHSPLPNSLDAFWDYLIAEKQKQQEKTLPEAAMNVLVRYAPTALSAGAWLASAVRIQNSHTLSGQNAMESFYLMSGRGEEGKERGHRYRSILGAAGLSLPALHGLAEDDRLCDSDFEPACIALLMGHCGPPLLPEILGFHAAKSVLGIPAPLARLLSVSSFNEDEQSVLARECLLALEQEGRCEWARVFSGAQLCVESENRWLTSLLHIRPSSVQERMEKIVKSRARYAYGFHGRVQMEGGAFDRWLLEGDAGSILRKLAASKHIVPGRPEDSTFLTQSVQFGGPMFGVFNDSEIQTIHEWIASLKDQSSWERKTAQTSTHAGAPSDSGMDSGIEIFWKDAGHSAQPSLPVLYRQLLNAEQYPEAAEWGRAYVRSILAKTEHRVSDKKLRCEKLLPYNGNTLKAWVDRRIHEQVHKKLPVSGSLMGNALSRKDVVWALTQLAPAALVDGGWLHGMFGANQSPQSILLFEIYRDELGSGIVRQHHGNIMKKTLAEAGVLLPEAHTAEFCAFADFCPAAFAMPAYWLSISENYREFFPELLGLNLAVEMAGVGQGYQAAVDALRVHKIDPYFFVLHNTIDNAFQGHTHLSVAAIERWIDSLPLQSGSVEFGLLWKRVWSGFFSYQTASRPLSYALARRFGLKILLAKIRELIGR